MSWRAIMPSCGLPSKSNSGHVFQIVGDSFTRRVRQPGELIECGAGCAASITDEPWGEMVQIRVRMGLHTGVLKVNEASTEMPYSGYSTLAFTQRIMSVAYGGQILLFGNDHRELLEGLLPAEVTLHDLGKHHLKDLLRPIHLYQVTTSDLPASFRR